MALLRLTLVMYALPVSYSSLVSASSSLEGAPPIPPAIATLTLLNDAAAQEGAVFLDGSPAGYYTVPGSPDHWLIYQQGGGWCSSDEDCVARSNTTLGSSKTYPPTSTTVMEENAYLSNDPVKNPMFFNWTRVYLSYGDGSSQTSNLDAPVVYGGKTIYYRGARVLKAVMDSLMANGLGSAKEVVITGCSAGGLSTWLHAPKWSKALPNARVVAMPDSGFFLNYPTSSSENFPANTTYPWRMWWTFTRTNSTGAMNQECLAAHTTEDAWLCMFAEENAPFMTVPTFPLQSVHDSYQIVAILHASAGNPNDYANITAYGDLMRERFETRFLNLHPEIHGCALDSCLHHCGGAVWYDLHFKGVSQGDAFMAWYQGGQKVFTQHAPFPCTACCTNA